MQIRTNGVVLETEVLPPPGAARGAGTSSPAARNATAVPPVLLVMGLGMQLTAWPDALIDGLHARAHTVIRFDNRDIGLSSKLPQWGRPRVISAALSYSLGMPVHAPYTVEDMARDALGLLDALEVPSVHLVGVSMGGMIGQVLAARHPARVASFTCVMSSSGARYLPGPTLRARRALMSRPDDPRDAASVIEHFVAMYGVLSGPAFPTPAAQLRERVAREVRRSHHPLGAMRQLVAVSASGDRSALLGAIRAPTVIVHGRADPLVPVAAAYDLGRKIPGATVRIVDGMGHDLAPGVVPLLLSAIDEAVQRASAAA